MSSPCIHLESTVGERYVKRKSDDLKERDLQENEYRMLQKKGARLEITHL